ncbi:uncharacterized protein CG3556-like [Stegodyphus dumicola]|uniref:uncharacterized protein CG3556-like n=1 Tax=Stegodyphus dumicola TaxID=202533 RepID=UPI0015A78435|nr:uncharacterized protein CG3556-like [Stegodyphus dumicola]
MLQRHLPQLFALVLIFFNCAYAGNFRQKAFFNGPCLREEFRCDNNQCVKRTSFCDGITDCSDSSDERYCSVRLGECPQNFFYCGRPNYDRYGRDKCIPEVWVCDGTKDCSHGKDENNCTNAYDGTIQGINTSKQRAIKYLLAQSKHNSSIGKWGPELNRIAVALYLAEKPERDSFSGVLQQQPAIPYELSLQFLSRLALKQIEDVSNTELAAFINAFLVSCINPRNFYVVDLVRELRKRVDSQNSTNPFAILALCNAGEHISSRDVEKLIEMFSSKQRQFWTDTQALIVMALSCAALQPNSNFDMGEIKEMTLELKQRQFRNGTVENVKTTALVLQALFASETEDDDEHFDEEKAIKQLLASQKSDGSFGNVVNTYYVLPILNYRSLVNISNKHCQNLESDEKRGLWNLVNQPGPKWHIQYSYWIGENRDVERNLKLRVPTNISLYTIMEMAAEVDSRFSFQYNVKKGKPYIFSLYDFQDDPENEKYWFPLFVKKENDEIKYLPITKSPADVIPQNHDHFVMWYK